VSVLYSYKSNCNRTFPPFQVVCLGERIFCKTGDLRGIGAARNEKGTPIPVAKMVIDFNDKGTNQTNLSQHKDKTVFFLKKEKIRVHEQRNLE
jgi:hypothetical protein